VVDIFQDAKEIGFALNTYNLVGLPNETPQMFQETIELNFKCQPKEAQLAVFFPYPGTELYYLCLDREYIKNPFFHHHFNGKERRTPDIKYAQFSELEILNCFEKFQKLFNS